MEEKREIQTKNGVYVCKKDIDAVFVKFEKPINIEVATKNLLDLQKVCQKHGLEFTLMYGTLLGAVREKGFIPHDHDTDVVVTRDKEEKVLDMLFDLRKIGLEVGRYDDTLISFVRDGDFIDIYFLDKKGSKYHTEGYVIPAHYLDNLIDYPFLGSRFKIPKEYESLLAYLYGDDWRTPKKNVSPTNYGLYLKIRYAIKNNSETLFRILSWIKGRLNV